MCSKMIKPLSRSSHQIKSNNKFIATDSNLWKKLVHLLQQN